MYMGICTVRDRVERMYLLIAILPRKKIWKVSTRSNKNHREQIDVFVKLYLGIKNTECLFPQHQQCSKQNNAYIKIDMKWYFQDTFVSEKIHTFPHSGCTHIVCVIAKSNKNPLENARFSNIRHH